MANGSSFVLKNGTVPWQGAEKRLDVHVRDGRIAALSENLKPDPNAEVIDVSDKYVLPGLIDGHTHLREFGPSASRSRLAPLSLDPLIQYTMAVDSSITSMTCRTWNGFLR